ncbi:MAG: hypothetical protein P4L67_01985 [Candidatus Pacebacteria bacterium]|nr:hypothetical protein [Candidatus Paceibacterota bacterium]
MTTQPKPSVTALLSGVATLCAVVFLASAGVAHASTNISSSGNAHWAWNNAIGWIDFYSPNTVVVGTAGIAGYASSSLGYISLDCHTSPSSGNICGTSNYQVTNDGTGKLSGWAWNDAIGWISFDCHNTSICGTSSYQVTIDTNGNFQGWAWNDAIGWIDFNCDNDTTCGTSNFYVNATWNATGTVGMLDSVTYDTGVAAGAQLNSVEWQGISGASGTSVQFQFAVSNASSGPWNFTGPDGTINTYYTPAGPNIPLRLNYTLYNNYRYFRYRATLVSTATSTPQVDNVIVNWSP